MEIAPASVPLCSSGEGCAILFARTPVPGCVKSRLWTRLTPEQACALHSAAASDMAALLDSTLPGIPHWLFLSEEPASGIGGSALILPSGWRCTVQEGTTLGDRMGAAFLRAFGSGARRVVIFGSDSPTLPPGIPKQAFEALAGCDLALGPTEDGGYYLIGCRRFDPQIFHRVEWGCSRTCEQTLANARSLGYRTTLLEPWFDLDEWKDVERLLADARRGISLPSHLAVWLQHLGILGEESRTARPR